MFHRDCACCDHSYSKITPPVPEDTTCNFKMKVNLGEEPRLFLIVMGKFYLLERYIYKEKDLHLRYDLIYQASLIFDETGKIYKNVNKHAEYIQKLVDNYGVNRLLSVTDDLSNLIPTEYYILMRDHTNSIRRYLVFQDEIIKFNKQLS